MLKNYRKTKEVVKMDKNDMTAAEETRRPQHDLSVTNKIQTILVKMYHPEAVSIQDIDLAAQEILTRHAYNFRKIVDIDGSYNPNNRLLDLWDENGDPKHIVDFIKEMLDILYKAELEVREKIKERVFKA